MFKTSTFIPTMSAHIKSRDGFDEKGKPTFGMPVVVGISPIRLERSIQATSIRADKSGSKSRAEEQVAQGRILVDPRAQIKEGDVMIILGNQWRVMSTYPRHDMAGTVSHIQVDLESWV